MPFLTKVSTIYKKVVHEKDHDILHIKGFICYKVRFYSKRVLVWHECRVCTLKTLGGVTRKKCREIAKLPIFKHHF